MTMIVYNDLKIDLNEKKLEEEERIKFLKNNHLINFKSKIFNKKYTIENILNYYFYFEIKKQHESNLNICYFYQKNKEIILIFNNENNEIHYISGLRDKGLPTTAFDCYSVLLHQGDDYKAAKYLYDNNSDINTVSHNYLPFPTPGYRAPQSFEKYLSSNLLTDSGIPLGYHYDEKYKVNFTISYPGEKHLVTIAPNGTGKGSTVQIPTLLQYDASILVIDPKGENAAVTSQYRRDHLHHQVLI